MKQKITFKQYEEILEHDEATKRFGEYLKKKGIPDPLLSIGQMIEFLGDDWVEYREVDWADHGCHSEVPPNNLLCDRLWEAVKEVLK